MKQVLHGSGDEHILKAKAVMEAAEEFIAQLKPLEEVVEQVGSTALTGLFEEFKSAVTKCGGETCKMMAEIDIQVGETHNAAQQAAGNM